MGRIVAQQGAAVGLTLTVFIIATPTTPFAAEHLEQFTAVAVNIGGARADQAATFDVLRITIDQWSTPAERNTLIDAFSDRGQLGFTKELSKRKAIGVVQLPNTAGYIRFARQMPIADGVRRIVVAIDPLTLYPFTVLELRVSEAGVGDGRWWALTKTADLLTLVGVDFNTKRPP